MKIVKVSSRGTVSLGTIAEETYYEVKVDVEGRIILTPVIIKPITEVRR